MSIRGIPLNRKLLEEGTEFEIDYDAFESSSEDDCFDDEVSNNFKAELAKVAAGEVENEIDLSTLSIDAAKPMMTSLTEDGMVLKVILREGTGPIIPNKSIVLMHYNASLEDQKKPFDSTYWRKNPHRFLLNEGHIIPGLYTAVSTMRKGELSKIWIHYEYAYGHMGCPPRIPADANIVYNVEILNFVDCKDAVEFEEMSFEDQKKAPFDKIYSVCRLEHEMGNDMFKSNKYPAAVARYQRARKLLEDVSVENEDDDKKRTERLLKLYLNLSICFLKLKNAKRAIFYCRNVLKIDEENTKALFRLGLAYMSENEFDLSNKYLLQAKARQPYNEEINQALVKLDEKGRKFKTWNKEFCKRMFQSDSENQKENTTCLLESPEFIQVIRDRIEQFKNSSAKEYAFSSGFTDNQLDVIRTIAVSQNLCFIEKIYDKKKIIKVMKKQD